MINLFHVGPKGFNIGNHAISLGLRYLLEHSFGDLVNLISIPATSRYETHRRAGLTASTVHEINQYGHGVIVGGGNLYENGELEVDLTALRALEPPLLLFSLSWGRIYNRQRQLVPRTDAMPDELIRALNDRAELSLVRDAATLQYLHELGATQASLGGCPTLLLDRMLNRLPELPEGKRGLALVSIRHPALMNIPLELQAEVHQLVPSLVEWLEATGYRDVRLLCHDHRDIPFAASLPPSQWLHTDDVLTYLALLRDCHINVTFRLHSAIPSFVFDRPFISLSYDERSRSLLETIGLSDWDFDIVTAGDPLAQVADRHARLSELGRLRDTTAGIRSQLIQTMFETFEEFAARVFHYQKSVQWEG